MHLKKKHISFSSLKDWKKCPHYYYLIHEKQLEPFLGNEHTAFGTAVHSVAEGQLIESQIPKEERKDTDWNKHFDEVFLKELKKINEKGVELNNKFIKEMREQSRPLIKELFPTLKEHFGNFQLIETEEELYEDIDCEKTTMKFKGFVDLIIKTEDGKYHIIDYKTTSWGWDIKRKSDKMVNYQLVLYKYYWARKHKIELSNIETHFVLVKRTAKKEYIEPLRVTSAKKRIDNANKLLYNASENIEKQNFIKNRLSCKDCKYFNTKHCEK